MVGGTVQYFGLYLHVFYLFEKKKQKIIRKYLTQSQSNRSSFIYTDAPPHYEYRIQ